MYSKLAIKNVKKSFKDYSIYFLTLTLAVCIFYSFNSIEAQKAIIEMKTSGKGYAETLISIISNVSVFVAVILGGLILYANNFLIKKRNKELGIYMTLGMGKGKISRILVLETVFVGAMSLVSGLILGLFTSQGLSVLVSKLFEVGMDEYRFVISSNAILKTIYYFGLMFLLVMMFNAYIISRYKIIDLLTTGKKVEEIKFKNPFIYIVAFLGAVVSLGYAYRLILEVGLRIEDIRFLLSILFGIIGTVLFFFSLAGFLLYIVKKNKKVYFKGLNIFTVKQINSKVNTNFISMAVICLMLFITIGILSTGLSYKSALESSIEISTPFDGSATLYISSEDKVKSIDESFKKIGYDFGSGSKIVYFNEYINDVEVRDIMPSTEKNEFDTANVRFLKISDYNNILKLKGEEEVKLSSDEVLVTSNFPKLSDYIEKYMKENDKINIKEKSYSIKNKELIKENYQTYFIENNLFTIIINDNFCENATAITSNLNINFSDENKASGQEKLEQLVIDFRDGKIDYNENGYITGYTRDGIYEENKSMTTTILFVGIYLGIVFLISSMAVLALQQLSEASDSIDRYVAIKRLGVSNKSINKSIFTQTLIYFTLPVVLAVVHSVVGIKVANEFIAMYNKPNIMSSSLITAGVFLTIYGVYFYTTYTGYKSIVKNNI